MNQNQARALEWLRKPDKQRMLYEGSDAGRRNGCGLFYIDWSKGESPVLNVVEVEQLLRMGYIKQKWRDVPSCYVLADKAGERT